MEALTCWSSDWDKAIFSSTADAVAWQEHTVSGDVSSLIKLKGQLCKSIRMKNRDRKDIIQDTKGSQMKASGLGQVNIQQLYLTVKWGAAVCGLFHLEGLVLQFSSSALCGKSMQVVQQGFFLHSAFILWSIQLLCQLRYTATSYHTCSCHIFSYMTKMTKSFEPKSVVIFY